nr:MAG TPA: hypothetical protein [Caudoviricetes sp.]
MLLCPVPCHADPPFLVLPLRLFLHPLSVLSA